MKLGVQHHSRTLIVVDPFSDLSPNLPRNPLRKTLPHFRRLLGRGKVGVIARWEDFLLDRTPGNCKKVTLDWPVDHDVYK